MPRASGTRALAIRRHALRGSQRGSSSRALRCAVRRPRSDSDCIAWIRPHVAMLRRAGGSLRPCSDDRGSRTDMRWDEAPSIATARPPTSKSPRLHIPEDPSARTDPSPMVRRTSTSLRAAHGHAKKRRVAGVRGSARPGNSFSFRYPPPRGTLAFRADFSGPRGFPLKAPLGLSITQARRSTR